MDEKIIWLLALTIIVLTKGAIIPLIRKLGNKKNNPINLDRFYQEFKDFKDIYFKEWKKTVDKKLDELEKRRK